MTNPTTHLRQRDIFWFWMPLFASWLLMTAEGPIVSAAINRLPNEVIMLAAQGIVVSLSVTIESPIINMLATATALVRDRQSYEMMRRFTVHWMIGLTAVSIAVAFTPLFDLIVVRLLSTPDAVAVWVRPGMQIMTLWSAAIAWRRFLQGVMIHFNQTRLVAWGTAVRLVTSGGVVIGLSLWGAWAGVINGTLALMAGVTAEAIYATLAIRPERITLQALDSDASRPDTTQLEGQIEQAYYIGTDTRYIVKTYGGATLTVRVQNTDYQHALTFKTGQPIRVTWTQQNARILAE